MSDLKQDLDNVRHSIRGMRDELKVQAHLMKMDLKDEWQKLEPKLSEAELYLDAVSDAAVASARDLERRLVQLKKRFHDLAGQHQMRPH